MARTLVGVAVMAMALTGLPLSAAAQSAGTTPRVTMTRGKETVTISARTERVRVSQTLTPSSFSLTMSDGRDAVDISGNTDGQVAVRRAGRSLALSMRDSTAREVEAVQALLRGSSAIARLGELATSSWGRSQKDAIVFVTGHAMAALLQGTSAPLKAIVHRLQASEPVLVRVQRTPGECWRAYERDVLSYTYDLEACIQESSYSLNPLRSAWCAYSYDLKATLAFVWLLDCNGY
jgi:hypothetical protein